MIPYWISLFVSVRLLNLTVTHAKVTVRVSISAVAVLEVKIPTLELPWLYYQRAKKGELSLMMMGSADKVESERQAKAEKRSMQDKERLDASKKSTWKILS